MAVHPLGTFHPQEIVRTSRWLLTLATGQSNKASPDSETDEAMNRLVAH
jgi:hypothetical protein